MSKSKQEEPNRDTVDGIKQSTRSRITRYSSNPFVEGMVVKTKKQRIAVGSFGEESDLSIFNTKNGHTSSPEGTVVAAVREVDDSQFVKLFTQNIGMMFGFTAAGNKTFGFLMWAVQNQAMRKDIVQLDAYTREDFCAENTDLVYSDRTMYTGLKELENGQIIAKAQKQGFFYINPNFIFNGDRIRFVTEIRRKKETKAEKLEKQGQQRLTD